MPVDKTCFRQCYILCLELISLDAGPLSIAICAIGCYWACGGGPDEMGVPAMNAQVDDPTVIADTGQDPNPPTPFTPEETAIADPSNPSADQGTIGDAPVDGSPLDTGADDWGGDGGGSNGVLTGDDGAPAQEDDPA